MTIIFEQRKRKFLNKELAEQITEMEEALPLKLKQRDVLKTNFGLVKQFNTLLKIVNERKMELLDVENERILLEAAEIINDLRDNVGELTELEENEKRQNLTTSTRKRLKTMIAYSLNDLQLKEYELDLKEGKHTDLFDVAHEKFSSVLSTALECFRDVEKSTSSVEEFVTPHFENVSAVETIKWMLKYKQSKGSQEIKSQLSLVQSILTRNVVSYEQNIALLTNEIEESKQDVNNLMEMSAQRWEDKAQEYQQQEKELNDQIHKLSSKIYVLEKSNVEFIQDIMEVAIKGQLDLEYIETLIIIEEFVMKLADLAADYLGPVFEYLQPDPEIERKVWPAIASTAKVILFLNGSTARTVHRMIIEAKLRVGPFVLLGINELPAESSATLSDFLRNQIKEAESLVRSDVRFSNALKQLLHEVVLVKDSKLLSELPNDRKIVVYSSKGLVCEARGCFTFNGANKRTQENQPIEVLRNVYGNVKKLCAVGVQIQQTKNVLEKLEISQQETRKASLKRVQETVLSAIIALYKLKQALHHKNQLTLMLRKDEIYRKSLSEIREEKIAEADEFQLQNQMEALKSQLIDEDAQLSELLENLDCKIEIFDSEIGNVGAQKETLVGSMSSLWEKGVEKEIRRLQSTQLRQRENELNNVCKVLQKESYRPVDTTRFRIKLHHILCQLYLKNTERAVNESATKLCLDETSNILADEELYDQNRAESNFTISAKIAAVVPSLIEKRRLGSLSSISKEKYGHLVKSIQKIKTYSDSPVTMITRSKVTSKTFPLANKFVVKLLKDAVHNFRASFNFIMTDFIEKSNFYFYTREMFEVKENEFSWNSFDMRKLKAMDFVVKWKAGKAAPESLRKIKGLLLALHIISYFSIFKFVVIDERIFYVSFETFGLTID